MVFNSSFGKRLLHSMSGSLGLEVPSAHDPVTILYLRVAG
jgi:hypothetical protein